MTVGRHPDLIEFDRAVAEHEARQLADELGYSFRVLADGTIYLEPPRDPEHERRVAAAIDRLFPSVADQCHDCGVELGPLSRFQVPVPSKARAGAWNLIYVCRRHYVARRHLGPS